MSIVMDDSSSRGSRRHRKGSNRDRLGLWLKRISQIVVLATLLANFVTAAWGAFEKIFGG